MIQLPEEITENHIKKHLLKGDVLFWENYKFEGGNEKHSRFIVLSECCNNSFFAIRATKRVDIYEKPSGFYREFIKLSAGEEPLFSKPTIIDINRKFILKIDKMKVLYGGQIKRTGRISDNLLTRIEKLVFNSKILTRNEINWILNSNKKNFLLVF